MPALLERPPAAPERQQTLTHTDGPDGSAVSGGPPPRDGGDGREPRRNLPLGVAVTIIVLVAALLTYLGMLTQIWANLSGAQLPGA